MNVNEHTVYLAKGNELNKMKQRGEGVDTLSLTLDHIALLMCVCLVKLHRSLCPYLWPPWEF